MLAKVQNLLACFCISCSHQREKMTPSINLAVHPIDGATNFPIGGVLNISPK